MSYIIEHRTGTGVTRYISDKPLIKTRENLIPQEPLPLRDMAPAYKIGTCANVRKKCKDYEKLIMDEGAKAIFR